MNAACPLQVACRTIVAPVAGQNTYGYQNFSSVNYPNGTTLNPIVTGLYHELDVNGAGSTSGGDLLSGYVATVYSHTGTIANSNIFEASSYLASSGTITNNHAFFNNLAVVGTGAITSFDAYTAGITSNNGTIGTYNVFACHADTATASAKYCLNNTDNAKLIRSAGAIQLISGASVPSLSTGQAVSYADAINGGIYSGYGSASDVDLTKSSLSSVLMIPHGTQQIAGRAGSMGAPTFTEFNDLSTGLYFDEVHNIFIANNGVQSAQLTGSGIQGANANGYSMRNLGATATAPTMVPNRADNSTGVGAQATGNMSMIVGGAEIGRWTSGGLILEAGYLQTSVVAVASLPSCSSATDGARFMVNNSNAAASGNFGVAVTAGGSNHIPVYCDGGTSTWRIG